MMNFYQAERAKTETTTATISEIILKVILNRNFSETLYTEKENVLALLK